MFLTWIFVAIVIIIVDIINCIAYPEKGRGKWWLLETIAIAVAWPGIVLLIIGLGIYYHFQIKRLWWNTKK